MRVHELSRPGTQSEAWLATLGVVVTCLAITAVCLPRTIQAGDAGEFATIMLAGGVPHPPGYPWMRMLGPVAQMLAGLGVPPATAAALLPGLAGVAAWAVLHRICVGLARPWSGAVLIGLAASSPLVITHVPDSEVWGLHLLFSALFMRAALRVKLLQSAADGRRHALALGLWLGLAFSHHQTAVLLVPLAIAGALPQPARLNRALLIHAGLGLAGVGLGLLVLLTLMVGSEGPWRWGEPQTLIGLARHVTRADYGTFSLSLHQTPVAAVDTMARMLASLGEVLSGGLVRKGWFGGLLMVATLITVMLSTRGASSSDRGPWTPTLAIGMTLSWLAASLGFAAGQNIDPSLASGSWILERFDLLPLLLWIPLLAIGLGALSDRIRARLVDVRPALLTTGAIAISIVLLAAQLGALVERGRPSEDRSIEQAALDLVRTPDPAGKPVPGSESAPIRAIVLGSDDHRTFPVLYVQSVLGEGQHTLYIDAVLFTQPWYRNQIRRRFADLPDVDMPLELIGALWSDPRFADVPIYLANVYTGKAARELKLIPEGLLWRVALPVDHPGFVAEAWTPTAIVERHLAACERMAIRASDFPELATESAAWAHPWSSDLRYAYVEKTHALVRFLVLAGEHARIPEILAALHTRTGVALDIGP